MELTLEKYSKKSLAIFGDTAPHKERLMALGGKFISNLKGRAGWIFFLNMQEKLEQFIAEQTQPEQHSPAYPLADRAVAYPLADVKSASSDLANLLSSINNMIKEIQQQFNLVTDIVEKINREKGATADSNPVQQVETHDLSEEQSEKPKSLLRRK